MLSENKLSWFPRYTLTPAIARALMEIEAARAVVEHTPLTQAAEAELRRCACGKRFCCLLWGLKKTNRR
jgi:hypothetical protein